MTPSLICKVFVSAKEYTRHAGTGLHLNCRDVKLMLLLGTCQGHGAHHGCGLLERMGQSDKQDDNSMLLHD